MSSPRLSLLGVSVSVLRRRRRRRMHPRPLPRRWPAAVQIVSGTAVGVGVALAGSLAGGLNLLTLRIFWGLAPDLMIVAVLVPLLLLAAGIPTLRERRAVRLESYSDLPPAGEGRGRVIV